MNNLRDLIEAIVLENAIKFGGKPSLDAVIKKLIGIKPEYSKGRIKELIPLIKEVIEVVSQMSLDTQRERFKEVRHLLPSEVKKEIKYELPPLPNAEYGKVVTRFAPNPDFVLHLGSLRPLTLSYYYARMYDGRFILRFEDTDPRTKKPEERYYKAILDDLKWLGMEPDEIYYQSERLEIYYKIAFELLRRGRAYICLCKRDEFKKYILNGQPCPHREQDPDINLDLFNKMLAGEYKEKEAVLRLKTGMELENPAIRDVPIMRISMREHPRVGTKYIVWPLLEFNWAIDDHLLGVTHILRGKDMIKEDIIESFVWDVFGWQKSVFVHYGRIRFKGISLSKSHASKMIKEGKYFGWDDPRVWSLQSLKSRGIFPEALRKVIVSMGLSLTDIEFAPETLYAENRRIIDPIANRYFCVIDPVKIIVKNLPFSERRVKIQKHPDFPDRGFRVIRVNIVDNQAEIYISEKDWRVFKNGSIVRLKDFVNIKVVSKDNKITEYHSKSIEEGRKAGAKIIHWVPSDTFKHVNIVMPAGQMKKGIAEESVKELKNGDIVQFERFGFVKIHKVNPILGYYAHS